MKKRYLLIVLSVAAVAVAAIGGTMAAKSDENVSITADISEKTVGVKANKTNIGSLPVVPGAEREVKYSVLNDAGKLNGTNSDNGGYDIYARVDVNFEWEQSEDYKQKYGTIDSKEDYVTLYINTGTENNPNYVTIPKNESQDGVYISSDAQQTRIGDWIITYYSNDQLTMYYTKPIENESVSSEFLSRISYDTAMDNKYEEAKYDISAEVSAIQADSAEDAFATEWGVYPVFKDNGNGVLMLESVSENAR